MKPLGPEPGQLVETDRDNLPARILRAEGAQRLVPDLTLGLLHKLNNVMTSVYFSADGCDAELEPGHPAREMLKALTDSVKQAQQLVTRAADVNLSLGSTETSFQDLNDLVRKDEELIRILLPKSVALTIETPGAPLIVRISIADFRRILLNFAANARDAHGERPKVTVSTFSAAALDWSEYYPEVDPRLRNGAAFGLSDNGHGIAESDLPQIWEPFYSTREDRIGLGLFQASRLAERNGGVLAVRRSGPGTQFICILPRVEED